MKANFETDIASGVNQEIDDRSCRLNLGEVFSLSCTSMGRSLNLTRTFLTAEEINLLQKMTNEEELKDLEESILIN